MRTNHHHRIVAAVAVVAGVLALTGCHSSGKKAAATATTKAPVTTPLRTCAASAVPVGFTLDTAHTGTLTPGQYSGSGDMQAAMIYDNFITGARQVFTNLGAPAPSNLVIQCTVLRFDTADDAHRFLSAYTALREQAGSLATAVTPAPAVAGHPTLEYTETGQGFSGYQIASTNVLELTAQVGAEVSTVSVAGPAPTVDVAQQLLTGLVTP